MTVGNEVVEIYRRAGSYDENEAYLAAKAFSLACDEAKLNMVGDKYLEEDALPEALFVYKLADNNKMIKFIQENFGDELDRKRIRKI